MDGGREGGGEEERKKRDEQENAVKNINSCFLILYRFIKPSVFVAYAPESSDSAKMASTGSFLLALRALIAFPRLTCA